MCKRLTDTQQIYFKNCEIPAVFLLTGMVNSRRVRRISFFEKFIMAYGGLRGAVCFSLSHMLRSDSVRPRELFLTTTLAVVIFTVFLQVTLVYYCGLCLLTAQLFAGHHIEATDESVQDQKMRRAKGPAFDRRFE